MVKFTIPVLLCLLLVVACADPTATPAPSLTPVPSPTPALAPTLAPTATPVPTATAASTPEPTPTNTPRPALEPPTATAAPTRPPTATPVPTATATSIPTATPVPTATPTPAPLPQLTTTAQELWSMRWNDDAGFQATQAGRQITITGRVAEVANGEVRLYADESEIFEPIPGAGVLFSSYIALRGLPIEVQQAAKPGRYAHSDLHHRRVCAVGNLSR